MSDGLQSTLHTETNEQKVDTDEPIVCVPKIGWNSVSAFPFTFSPAVYAQIWKNPEKYKYSVLENMQELPLPGDLYVYTRTSGALHRRPHMEDGLSWKQSSKKSVFRIQERNQEDKYLVITLVIERKNAESAEKRIQTKLQEIEKTCDRLNETETEFRQFKFYSWSNRPSLIKREIWVLDKSVIEEALGANENPESGPLPLKVPPPFPKNGRILVHYLLNREEGCNIDYTEPPMPINRCLERKSHKREISTQASEEDKDSKPTTLQPVSLPNNFHRQFPYPSMLIPVACSPVSFPPNLSHSSSSIQRTCTIPWQGPKSIGQPFPFPIVPPQVNGFGSLYNEQKPDTSYALPSNSTLDYSTEQSETQSSIPNQISANSLPEDNGNHQSIKSTKCKDETKLAPTTNSPKINKSAALDNSHVLKQACMPTSSNKHEHQELNKFVTKEVCEPHDSDSNHSLGISTDPEAKISPSFSPHIPHHLIKAGKPNTELNLSHTVEESSPKRRKTKS